MCLYEGQGLIFFKIYFILFFYFCVGLRMWGLVKDDRNTGKGLDSPQHFLSCH